MAILPGFTAETTTVAQPPSAKTANLKRAQKAKNDEFYTLMEDIQVEVKHYIPQLKDKMIYCCCDDPNWSNFYKHFHDNFEEYGLKRLVATHYDHGTGSWCVDITRSDQGVLINRYKLKGNGDFRSQECVDLLEQVDVVITNPPFSLFREFFALLIQSKRKFLVIGNVNAITYKSVFKHIKDGHVKLGYSQIKKYHKPKSDGTGPGDELFYIGNTTWYTNLERKNNPSLSLTCQYKGNEKGYPKYDNFDAIEVSRTKNIPTDYTGLMGVPVSFIEKYNPEQFEIVCASGAAASDGVYTLSGNLYIDGKCKFKRIIIKNKF